MENVEKITNFEDTPEISGGGHNYLVKKDVIDITKKEPNPKKLSITLGDKEGF